MTPSVILPSTLYYWQRGNGKWCIDYVARELCRCRQPSRDQRRQHQSRGCGWDHSLYNNWRSVDNQQHQQLQWMLTSIVGC